MKEQKDPRKAITSIETQKQTEAEELHVGR